MPARRQIPFGKYPTEIARRVEAEGLLLFLRTFVRSIVEQDRRIVDAINRQIGPESIELGDTGAPTFSNNWAHATPGQPLTFWKDARDVVTIMGTVDSPGDSNSPANPSTIFTLPEGYRPSASSLMIGASVYDGIATPYLQEVHVLSSGVVEWRGPAASFGSGRIEIAGFWRAAA